MREYHIHLYVDPDSPDSDSIVHVHLKTEREQDAVGTAPTKKQKQQQKRSGTRDQRLAPPAPPGLNAPQPVPSGHQAAQTNRAAYPELTAEQRIRSRMYRLTFVPPTAAPDARNYYDKVQSSAFADGLLLELATGNQQDPVVWDCFQPPEQRGMWRFTVREEFGRLIGTVTSATDKAAIWVLSEWTPRGALVLEPADSRRYPRLHLQPASPPVA